MAQDGLFFKGAATVHPRFKTPSISTWLQSFWSIVLILSGTFEELLTYVTFAILLFSSLTGASVFVLRRRFKGLDRPYQVWGYPWVPGLFILTSVWIMANVLWTQPFEAFVGLGLMVAGIPVYAYWRRRRKR
jgi:APA family basic amino acid/polyamine antiporter